MERDGFVSIQYQNIQPSALSNFEKASSTNAFGVPYDYGSVMHYSSNAFSTNGRPTIVAVVSKYFFSFTDVSLGHDRLFHYKSSSNFISRVYDVGNGKR